MAGSLAPRYSPDAGAIALVPCDPPTGELADAPLSALVPIPSSWLEEWSGHWGEDDRYYARLRWTDTGQAWWFRLDVIGGMVRQTSPEPTPRRESAAGRAVFVGARNSEQGRARWSLLAQRIGRVARG
jgi:hypothetical protein